MGVKELTEAFNSVAAPKFTASKAFLNYDRRHDSEWQILTFSGTAADGTAFEFKSVALRGGSDVIEAAKQAAQLLLEREGHPP